MRITFLGTRGEVEESSKAHKLHMGILIEATSSILVDIGEKEYLDLKPEAIILTHYHPDHFHKGIESIEIPLYSLASILELIPENIVKVPKRLEIGEKLRIGAFTVSAYSTLHSKKTPSIALKITHNDRTALISSDVIAIRDREEAMKDVDLYIGDGSFLYRPMVRKDQETGDIYGHTSVKSQIAWALKAGIKNIVFTHFGTEAIKMGYRKLQNELEELLKSEMERLDIKDKFNILAAKDNMAITVLEKIEVKEIEPKVFLKPEAGLILVKPHAELIVQGKKTAVCKVRRFEAYINVPLYLIQDKKVWGIITLGEPEEITWEEFKERFNEHQITMEEANQWQWTRHKTLWLYPVKVLQVLDPPRDIDYPLGPQTFVKAENIKWL